MKIDFLHRLTGRTSDFVEPLLNHGEESDAPQSEPALREWMGLYDRKTDIHVRALLAVAEAYPVDSGISGMNVSVMDLPLEGFRITGASPGHTARQPFDFHVKNLAFPFSTEWVIGYAGPGTMSLTRGAVQELVPVDFQDSTMCPVWPIHLGVSGNLSLHQPWQEGARILIHNPPRRYPYQALIAGLLRRDDGLRLLETKGIIGSAYNLSDPLRAVALVVRALTS
jgi:hypothetical protein